MAKPTREERRLEKEQAKAAKAEARAVAKAAKAESRSAPKERKGRKQRRADEAALGLEPVAVPEPIVMRPRLELVVEPGPVKHLHWDAEERARLAAEEASAEETAPEPAPAPLPEAPRELPVLGGRRRTLYTTENGNQVVAYERAGSRQLAITEQRGGRLEEVPFDESRVDRIVGEEPEPPVLQETAGTAPQGVEAEEPKRGFFRRRKAEPTPPATPVVEHVYRPVELVDSMPLAQAETPLVTKPTQTQQVEAWEPDASLRQVVRPARPVPAPRAKKAVRKVAPTLRQAPRKPRRKLVHKPALVYPGDNHPVIDIEGVGPTYAKKLEKMRITTTGLLNVARAGRVAKKLKVPAKTVRKWQAQAELIKVRGIGPQYAEALARSGVKGIDELKKRDAEGIAKQVAKYLRGLDATVVGQPLTPKRIAQWQRKAKPMRRVKVNLETLAVPDHGIPPPWLRETTGKSVKKAVRKTAKKAGK
jgi:predicted flap endonuclease-1-like 5' DNA nuclease